MKKLIARIISAVLLLFVLWTSFACTVFSSTENNTTMAGNNEDWFDKDTFIWFIPAQDGNYGCAFYGFENAHPQGGLNEKGLFFDWFAQGGSVSPTCADKLNYNGDLSNLILQRCATVDEVLALYDKYNDVNLGYATMLLADATGDKATITWDWQNNKPLVQHQNSRHMEIGVGAKAIIPMLEQKGWSDETGFKAMVQMAANENTLYSTVCNLTTKKIVVYNQRNFDSNAVFNLPEELAKGAHVLSIPFLFPSQKPGLANQLTPYNMRTSLENMVNMIIIALLAAIALYSLLEIILSKKKSAGILPITGVLANGAVTAFALYLNTRIYFVANYGIRLYGISAVLFSYIITALALAQLILLIRAWAKKQQSLTLRILFSISSIFIVYILLYLTTLGVI